MSKAFSEKMEQEYYDERFLQEAARQVDSNLLEELNASQSMDVDEAWLQNIKMRAHKSIVRKKRRRNGLTALRRMGRCAAILLLTVCLSSAIETVEMRLFCRSIGIRRTLS